MTKIEFKDDDAYSVVSVPYIVKDGEYEYRLALELVNKVANAAAPYHREVHNKDKELDALISNSTGGVISISVINKHIIPAYFSQGICRLLGYSEEELFHLANTQGFNCMIHNEDMATALIAVSANSFPEDI